jgi:hypothetical protein
VSFTQLRNDLKTKAPEQAFSLWSNAFNTGKSGAQPLPPDWIKHLMDVSRTGMGLKQTQQPAPKAPVQQAPVQQPAAQPEPVAEQRLFNALVRPVTETARMSAAVKLQRAWNAQQAKSAASRERAKQLLNPPKPQEPKKDEKPLDELIFFKSGMPKKQDVPAKSEPSSAEMRKYFQSQASQDKPLDKNIDKDHPKKVYVRHAEESMYIPVSEDIENIMNVLINKIIVNEAIQNNKR